MAGSFELKKSANGQFHFSLKAGNNEIILKGEMYNSKKSARAGIASVQSNARNNDRYSKLTSANGKFYFSLKAANHKVIGTGELYSSEAGRDAGIKSVKANGITKVIEDQT